MTALTNPLTRRGFLGQAATASSALTAATRARVLGANDRINVALIGVGNLGIRHLRERLLPLAKETQSIQMVAACDIYEKAKERATALIGLDRKDIHHDYREMLGRADVDAVVIVTPEHHHYRMAMDALAAGKDIYLEKPMTYSIGEAREIAEAVRKSGRVLQVGSQHVSDPRYQLAREVIEKGWIGEVLGAQTAWSSNLLHGLWQYRIEPEATEKSIDWKAFLGSAPKRPFSAERYFRWRKYWDYSGGMGPDLFYHELSPMMLAIGPQFPVRVSAHGGIRFSRDREVPDVFSMTAEYEKFAIELSGNSACAMVSANRRKAIFGREATISFASGAIEIKPERIFRSKFEKATGKKELRLEREPKDDKSIRMAHFENFFLSMRTRKQPVLDADFGYRVMTAIKLGVDSYRESRMMAFDPRSERVVNHSPKRPGYDGTGENYEDPGGALSDGRTG
ncbi:MAG: Gfo/Idh/MocA family oxidoreductase [Bryobacteraceae bacterium]